VTTRKLVRSPKVLWRRTLRGVVLRRVGADTIMLDGSGWLIWDTLASPATLDELSEQLAARTVGEVETIAADVQPVLDELEKLGAVVPAS
jgi:Coenzyme PQQ synthesis protein D (PqqD)